MIVSPSLVSHAPVFTTPELAEVEPRAPAPSVDSSLQVVDLPDLALGTYVVSAQRSGFRRLHRIGNCLRQPGADYVSFEVLGPDEPSPEAFIQRCKQC